MSAPRIEEAFATPLGDHVNLTIELLAPAGAPTLQTPGEPERTRITTIGAPRRNGFSVSCSPEQALHLAAQLIRAVTETTRENTATLVEIAAALEQAGGR